MFSGSVSASALRDLGRVVAVAQRTGSSLTRNNRRRPHSGASASTPSRCATSSGARTQPASRIRCSGDCPCSRTWALKPDTRPPMPPEVLPRQHQPHVRLRTHERPTPLLRGDQPFRLQQRDRAPHRRPARLVALGELVLRRQPLPAAVAPPKSRRAARRRHPDTGSDLAIQDQRIVRLAQPCVPPRLMRADTSRAARCLGPRPDERPPTPSSTVVENSEIPQIWNPSHVGRPLLSSGGCSRNVPALRFCMGGVGSRAASGSAQPAHARLGRLWS